MKNGNLFNKKYNHLLWNLGEFFFFLPTELRQACQNFVVFVQTDIFTNRFFWKAYKVFLISGVPAKVFRFWRESFDRLVTTTFYMCRSTIWGKITFFQSDEKNKFVQKIVTSTFFGFGESFSYSWQQSYGRLAENSLCMFWRTFWGEIILFGKRIIFSSFSGFEQMIFSCFDENFLAGWSQLHFLRTSAHFEETYFPF